MEKRFLKSLIDKFQAGTISESERKQLDLWYQSFENDQGHTDKLLAEEKAALEASLLKKINARIDVPQPSKKGWFIIPDFDLHPRYLPNLRTAAAFSLVIFVAVFSYFFLYHPTTVHATGYGQTAHIVLPDQSSVFLNGNSTLSYKKRWSNNGIREVFLDGEAFFDVSHSQNQQKFLVHTADGFYVEVLGTEFAVSKRTQKTRVVLNSGKIGLIIKDQHRNEKISMNPGELVEFGDNPLQYTKKNVNPEVYSSWKDRKLILERTSLQELLTMIEDVYGLKLGVDDENLLEQRISGKIPAQNLDTLIQDISAIYKVKFQNYKYPAVPKLEQIK
jgi:transmembrane sensor